MGLTAGWLAAMQADNKIWVTFDLYRSIFLAFNKATLLLQHAV